jgi:hypothetical protein
LLAAGDENCFSLSILELASAVALDLELWVCKTSDKTAQENIA